MIQGSVASQGRGTSYDIEDLKAFCTFYTSLEDWIGNELSPEVGTGKITRNSVNDTSGIIGNASDITLGKNDSDSVLRSDINAIYMTDGVSDLDYSVSLWLSVNAIGSLAIFLSTIGSDGCGIDVRFSNASTIRIAHKVNGTDKDVSFTGLNIPINQYFHLAYSFSAIDGGSNPDLKAELFINGVSMGLNNGNNRLSGLRPINKNRHLSIGSYQGGLYPLNGKIDEVAFFKNKIITQADAAALHNNGSGLQIF